jgi:hypothetical protein
LLFLFFPPSAKVIPLIRGTPLFVLRKSQEIMPPLWMSSRMVLPGLLISQAAAVDNLHPEFPQPCPRRSAHRQNSRSLAATCLKIFT